MWNMCPCSPSFPGLYAAMSGSITLKRRVGRARPPYAGLLLPIKFVFLPEKGWSLDVVEGLFIVMMHSKGERSSCKDSLWACNH